MWAISLLAIAMPTAAPAAALCNVSGEGAPSAASIADAVSPALAFRVGLDPTPTAAVRVGGFESASERVGACAALLWCAYTHHAHPC